MPDSFAAELLAVATLTAFAVQTSCMSHRITARERGRESVMNVCVLSSQDDELSRSLQRQPRRRRVAVSPQQQQQQDLGAVAQQVPLPSPHNRRSARLTIHVQPLNAPPAAGDHVLASTEASATSVKACEVAFTHLWLLQKPNSSILHTIGGVCACRLFTLCHACVLSTNGHFSTICILFAWSCHHAF